MKRLETDLLFFRLAGYWAITIARSLSADLDRGNAHSETILLDQPRHLSPIPVTLSPHCRDISAMFCERVKPNLTVIRHVSSEVTWRGRRNIATTRLRLREVGTLVVRWMLLCNSPMSAD